MKKILPVLLFLFSSMAMAQQMPMPALQGKFFFHGESRIVNKVRSIYIAAHNQNLDDLIKKYQAAGYVCEALENDDYECGRNEPVTSADQVWVEKANTSNSGSWLKFAEPSEPPVLDHDYGDASIWTVTQDLNTSDEHQISEIQYHFSKISNGISFFDMAAMTQNDFEMISAQKIKKEITYRTDEHGTQLEVTVACDFDRHL